MSHYRSFQELLSHIHQLLESGQAEKALHLVEKIECNSPELKNALGVCQLRLGRVENALNVLRELVFQRYMSIPAGTEPLYQANYVTVLLLKNYNQMALEVLQTLSASDHPYIAKLHGAVAQWRKTLPLHHKILASLKLYPNKPIALDFLPGEI